MSSLSPTLMGIKREMVIKILQCSQEVVTFGNDVLFIYERLLFASAFFTLNTIGHMQSFVSIVYRTL